MARKYLVLPGGLHKSTELKVIQYLVDSGVIKQEVLQESSSDGEEEEEQEDIQVNISQSKPKTKKKKVKNKKKKDRRWINLTTTQNTYTQASSIKLQR